MLRQRSQNLDREKKKILNRQPCFRQDTRPVRPVRLIQIQFLNTGPGDVHVEQDEKHAKPPDTVVQSESASLLPPVSLSLAAGVAAAAVVVVVRDKAPVEQKVAQTFLLHEHEVDEENYVVVFDVFVGEETAGGALRESDCGQARARGECGIQMWDGCGAVSTDWHGFAGLGG